MRNKLKQPALLANLAGPHLPPVALSVPAQLQFCVDAGAAAAMCFFDEITAVGLHDHIAFSMHAYLSSLRPDAVEIDEPQAVTDAFAAGYLGRIQQELRLFQGDGLRRRSAYDDPHATAKIH